MIKAILFDLGGVLINQPHTKMFAYIAAHLKIPKTSIEEIYKVYFDIFQKGTITEAVLWKKICKELHSEMPQSHSLWEDAFKAAYVERKEMFNLAQKLCTQGYKIGLISNTERPAIRSFRTRYTTFFDITVFSCDVGCAKPEPKIYSIALERLQEKPSATIFIDDNPAFVHAADKFGMQGILFTRFEDVQQKIEFLVAKP